MSAPMSQDSNARTFQDRYRGKNAEMFPDNSARMCQGSSVKTFPGNSAGTCPTRSAPTFPANNARTCPASSVARCPDNSALLPSLPMAVKPDNTHAHVVVEQPDNLSLLYPHFIHSSSFPFDLIMILIFFDSLVLEYTIPRPSNPPFCMI